MDWNLILITFTVVMTVSKCHFTWDTVQFALLSWNRLNIDHISCVISMWQYHLVIFTSKFFFHNWQTQHYKYCIDLHNINNCNKAIHPFHHWLLKINSFRKKKKEICDILLTFVKRSFHANFLLQTHSVITIQQNTAANCRHDRNDNHTAKRSIDFRAFLHCSNKPKKVDIKNLNHANKHTYCRSANGQLNVDTKDGINSCNRMRTRCLHLRLKSTFNEQKSHTTSVAIVQTTTSHQLSVWKNIVHDRLITFPTSEPNLDAPAHDWRPLPEYKTNHKTAQYSHHETCTRQCVVV